LGGASGAGGQRTRFPPDHCWCCRRAYRDNTGEVNQPEASEQAYVRPAPPPDRPDPGRYGRVRRCPSYRPSPCAPGMDRPPRPIASGPLHASRTSPLSGSLRVTAPSAGGPPWAFLRRCERPRPCCEHRIRPCPRRRTAGSAHPRSRRARWHRRAGTCAPGNRARQLFTARLLALVGEARQHRGQLARAGQPGGDPLGRIWATRPHRRRQAARA